MTTLAIIGGGIAGRSLLYALAKEKNHYSQIYLFDAPEFFSTCSLNSTAVVAPRGISTGHSDLGDILAQGFETFQDHVVRDQPSGVAKIVQYTATSKKIEEFKKRYPVGEETREILNFKLPFQVYLAREEAYLIHPKVYLKWLLETSKAKLPVNHHMDLVKQLERGTSQFEIRTQSGQTVTVDQVALCGGQANRFWKVDLPELSQVNPRPVQGAYFEIDMDLGNDSFSLTLAGDNLIYHADRKVALVGATTNESHLEIPPAEIWELRKRVSEALSLEMPQGEIRVGLREKAKQRRPYLLQDSTLVAVGGFYKNGFSLGLSFGLKASELLVRK